MTMTLGTMIDVIDNGFGNVDDDATIHYYQPDLEDEKTNNHLQGIGEFYSWRGSYEQLCLSAKHENDWMSLHNFFCLLRGVNGMKFTGYKGGEYEMNDDTFIWRESYGNSNRMTQGITHLTFDCSMVKIHTKLMDTWRFIGDVDSMKTSQ